MKVFRFCVINGAANCSRDTWYLGRKTETDCLSKPLRQMSILVLGETSFAANELLDMLNFAGLKREATNMKLRLRDDEEIAAMMRALCKPGHFLMMTALAARLTQIR